MAQKKHRVVLAVNVTFQAKTATANAKNLDALMKLLEKRADAFELRRFR